MVAKTFTSTFKSQAYFVFKLFTVKTRLYTSVVIVILLHSLVMKYVLRVKILGDICPHKMLTKMFLNVDSLNKFF